MENKKNKKMNEDEELEMAYKIFKGENPNEAINTEVEEQKEPYENIEETTTVLKLPFEVSEGDLLDLNAVVNKINEDGSVEIVINKAFKK